MKPDSAGKPVYVPSSGRRRKRDERLHGAFTGGFSAGYYNTVGSKEGWKPQQEETEQSGKAASQSLDYFMDEQDYNEWGGPIKAQSHQDERQSSTHHQTSLLDDLWTVNVPKDVGKELLARLGWRSGSDSAVLVDQSSSAPGSNSLSKRRMLRIQLAQTNVQIPPAKLDSSGLGFGRFSDAPEFQKHFEDRQRRAQAKAVKGQNVYRIDDIVDGSTTRRAANVDTTDSAYMANETMEDFVGNRSSSGFALQDDEDDAYDDERPYTKLGSTSKIRLNKDAYDTVIYDNEHDDLIYKNAEKGGGSSSKPTPDLFSAWQNKTNQTSSQQATTSDGRPPLKGFILGGSDSSLVTERFSGPDVPSGEIARHVFHPDEHPRVYQVLSKAIELEKAATKNKIHIEESLKKNFVAEKKVATANDLHLTTHFTGLAAAMKNRFTSESGTAPVEEVKPNVETKNEHTKVAVRRSTFSFMPVRLLSKRFHVPPLTSSSGDDVAASRTSTEQTYFENEILTQIDRKQATSAKIFKREEVAQTVEPVKRHERPPMALYKSIFDPESDGSSDDDYKDGDEGKPGVGTVEEQALVVYGAATGKQSPESVIGIGDSDSERKDRHRKKRKKKKHSDRERKKDSKKRSRKRSEHRRERGKRDSR